MLWYNILLWYVSDTPSICLFLTLIHLFLPSFWYYLKNCSDTSIIFECFDNFIFLHWYQNTSIHSFLILQNTLIFSLLIFVLMVSSLLWYQNEKKRKKYSFHIYCSDIKNKKEKNKIFLWTIAASIRKILQIEHFLYKKGRDLFHWLK